VDLLPALENFGNLFAKNGELIIRFERVRALITELHEADPGYQKKLGSAKAYSVADGSETLKFLIDNYIGGRWWYHTTLQAVVERLFAQVGVKGNPFNDYYEKELIKK